MRAFLKYRITDSIVARAYSFNGKTSVSKTVVPRSSRGGPAYINKNELFKVFIAP